MQPRRFGAQGTLLYSLVVAGTLAALAYAPSSLGTEGSAKATRAPTAQGGLSAEQIVAKNVAARGGLEAWRHVQTMVWLGHIESTHSTVPGMLFMLSQRRPNKMRFEINAMGDKTVRVFDGAQGWRLRPAHGQPEVRPYSIDEIRFEQGGPGIDGPLIDSAAKGSSVSLAGVDQIEKRRAYHMVVKTAAGETQHVWVDTESFLEVRYDRAVVGAGGSRTLSVVYRDYKTTDGLQIPSIIETGAGAGSTPDRMVIERVAVNPPLDDRTFAEPGAQRPRERVALPPRRHAPPPAWLLSNSTGAAAQDGATAPGPAAASGSASSPGATGQINGSPDPAKSPRTQGPGLPGSGHSPGPTPENSDSPGPGYAPTVNQAPAASSPSPATPQ